MTGIPLLTGGQALVNEALTPLDMYEIAVEDGVYGTQNSIFLKLIQKGFQTNAYRTGY